jgi:Xaa-Pro aminopeptidase
MTKILPIRQRAQLYDTILKERIHTIIPDLMHRYDIDCWLVMCREFNEDPLFWSMVPHNTSTSGKACFIFTTVGGKFQAISVSRFHGDLSPMYDTTRWDPNKEEQYECVKRILEELNPKKIGVNISEINAMADGLSKTRYDYFVDQMGPELSSRIVSAELLCIGWLETRLPQELRLYEQIYKIMMDIIDRAFSTEVITPYQTTTNDVEDFIMEEVNRQSLPYWFTPTLDLQRKGEPNSRLNNCTILPGDLIHCDVGLKYLGLCTDTQRLGYIPMNYQDTVPQGLLDAMKTANRFQDIVRSNFAVGRSGNEVLMSSYAQAKEEGIEAMLYTHPIGFYGHGAGPTIGQYMKFEPIPGGGDLLLHKNTCFALELNIAQYVPEWDQKVYMYVEETVAFDGEKVNFLAEGRDRIILVK